MEQGEKPTDRLGIGWNEEASLTGGVSVSAVTAGSPAARAGVRVGDCIVRFAGRDIRCDADFFAAVATAESPASLTLRRAGEVKPLELKLELLGDPLRWGMAWRVDDAEPGVVILTHVVPGTPAARADLRLGDRICQVAGRDFVDEKDFVRAMKNLPERLPLLVERQGRMAPSSCKCRRSRRSAGRHRAYVAQPPRLCPARDLTAEGGCTTSLNGGCAASMDVAGRQAALLQVLLVIIFRPPKCPGRNDLGDDGSAKRVTLGQPLFHGDGRLLLLRGVIKDDRAILRADVGALAVARGRVVVLPKNFEQLLVADPARIVLDLDHLGMAGAVGAHVMVAGVFQVSPLVTHGGRRHPFQLAKRRLHAPKTPAAEGSFFHLGRSLFLSRCRPRTGPQLGRVLAAPHPHSRQRGNDHQ